MYTRLKQELRDELTTNILPYWIKNLPDFTNGGFYGQITGEEKLVTDAPKGAIMHSRILWTFSAAYRILGNKEYLEMATRAKDFILKHFLDKELGGVYWELTAQGEPSDTKKQFYALGFTIYGLSEYFRATGNDEALKQAVSMFEAIDQHSRDSVMEGYVEATTRDWKEIGDLRLSDKDANEKKTMNTHLHILEAYSNLYRVWPDELLKKRLVELIVIFLDKIVQPSGHLGLFFDENWQMKGNDISYGHDIEASWLLLEAAMVAEDSELLSRTKAICHKIAIASLKGLRSDGSMVYEMHANGQMDEERHWWVQAEAVVGLCYLYKYHNDEKALELALQVWEYIKTNLIDISNGEWYWSILADGKVNLDQDKAGFWKCPYHNGRMCMEILEMEL